MPMAALPTESMNRRFAVACDVLGQYVRAGAPVTAMPAAAAPLFLAPAGAAGQLEAAATNKAAPQQLTIFYGGRVVVLDACPPEKAAELIRLAAAAQAAPASEAAPAALVDMPIARKASLRRFLAKRKDRSSSTASAAAYDRQDDEEPEQQAAAKKGKVVATREEGSSSWLALGLGGAMHGRR